jgi:hypothetical protein
VAKLRIKEKRKGFSGFAVLGSECSAWLLSVVEEVLGHLEIEDFVKSFREGSSVTFTRVGENRSGRFLEVAVFAMGGRKRRVCFPEGRDGQGWGHASGELSKALAFFGAKVGSLSTGGPPTTFKMGKKSGFSSFTEVVPVDSVLGYRPMGQTPVPRGVSLHEEPDCPVLEEQLLDPLGKVLWTVERSSSRDFGNRTACVSREDVVEADVSLRWDSILDVLNQILELLRSFTKSTSQGFSKKSLSRACGSSKGLGFKPSVGLFRRVGFLAGLRLKRCKFIPSRVGANTRKPMAEGAVVKPGPVLSLVPCEAMRRVSNLGSSMRLGNVQNPLFLPESSFSAASAASALAWSRQNGSRPDLTLLTSQAMATGSLSLSLELLLSYQHKVKFPHFAGIYSATLSEASPLVIPVAKENVVLCGGLAPELEVGSAQDSSPGSCPSMGRGQGPLFPNS